ncbi:MAG: Arc family DNA-binding protein [Clostridia bacterium]|nr:Arc family DNA-binding protein [Clostridia bacterium]
MAGNYYAPFSLRISENLLDKIKYLAEANKRSANKEIEFILENYIKEFEKANGEIQISSDE